MFARAGFDMMNYNHHVEGGVQVRTSRFQGAYAILEGASIPEAKKVTLRCCMEEACNILAGMNDARGKVQIAGDTDPRSDMPSVNACLAVLLGPGSGYYQLRPPNQLPNFGAPDVRKVNNPQLDLVSRRQFDEVAFIERHRLSSISRSGDKDEDGNEKPSVLREHADQIIEIMRQIPTGYWMCSHCACPTGKSCSCKLRHYCCTGCQRADWKHHKNEHPHT
jgi:hypothetical protein